MQSELLVVIEGKKNGKDMCCGIVLKYIRDDHYKILAIAPILKDVFYRTSPITLENINAKCQNNGWKATFSGLER